MSTNNDGGPAFPTTPVNHGYSPDMAGHGTGSDTGMTLRDWFAGQALCGLVQDPNMTTSKAAAMGAYDIADAMIATRKKLTL